MVARAFHDAVIDHLARTSTQLDAMCSMVSVYENDALLRQESGTLRIVGPVPDGSSEPGAGSEAAYDDASILDLVVKDGVVSLAMRTHTDVVHLPAGQDPDDLDDASLIALMSPLFPS